MSTAKVSMSSLFSVISNSANAVSSIASTIGNSATVLDNEVSHFSKKLVHDNSLDLASHKLTSLAVKAQELAQTRETISKYRDKSEFHAQLYDTALADLAAAMKD